MYIIEPLREIDIFTKSCPFHYDMETSFFHFVKYENISGLRSHSAFDIVSFFERQAITLWIIYSPAIKYT